jgi:hypothetical protein
MKKLFVVFLILAITFADISGGISTSPDGTTSIGVSGSVSIGDVSIGGSIGVGVNTDNGISVGANADANASIGDQSVVKNFIEKNKNT